MHLQTALIEQARFAEPSARPRCGKVSGDKRWTDARTRLMAVTVEIIDALDWSSMTPGAMTKACSISIPAMYKHFPDEAALFEAVQEKVSGKLGVFTGAAAHENPVDSVLDVGKRLIACSEEHSSLLEFTLFGPSSNNTSAVDTGTGVRWELLAFVHREIRRLIEPQPLPPWHSADEAGRDPFVSL